MSNGRITRAGRVTKVAHNQFGRIVQLDDKLDSSVFLPFASLGMGRPRSVEVGTKLVVDGVHRPKRHRAGELFEADTLLIKRSPLYKTMAYLRKVFRKN